MIPPEESLEWKRSASEWCKACMRDARHWRGAAGGQKSRRWRWESRISPETLPVGYADEQDG